MTTKAAIAAVILIALYFTACSLLWREQARDRMSKNLCPLCGVEAVR